MPALVHDIYTNTPGAGPYVIFPTHAHQILSNCIHIFGVSILSYCLARRTESVRFMSSLWWSNLSWARLLVILVFLDSWVFLAFSGILVNGIGLSFSAPVCSLGIFTCVFFYAGSKALIYLFLVERVWIVCSAGKSVTRFESNVYRGCAIILSGYVAIFIVMIVGRFAAIREDGVCVIGLQRFATIPLLTYDLFINIFLTSMFLWILYREEQIGERLRRLARRTALASAVALTTSCVNILMLSLLNGRQLGWVCLGSCAADVTANAIVLFWVTAGASREPHWHGAWEVKEYEGDCELPSLNYPVEGREEGLERVWTDETARAGARAGTAGMGGPTLERQARMEELHKRELSQARMRSSRSMDAVRVLEEGHHADAEDSYGDTSSILEDDTEWDIPESACSTTSTSTQLQFNFPSDKEKGIRESSTPWRLTLDLEHPPPLEHSEPDSPETAGSSRRLTKGKGLGQGLGQGQIKARHTAHARQRWHVRQRSRRGRTRTSPTPMAETALRSTHPQPQPQLQHLQSLPSPHPHPHPHPQPPPIPPLPPMRQGSRHSVLRRGSDPPLQTQKSYLDSPGEGPR